MYALYRGLALDGVHHLRRLLDRLFALCDPVTFDPILINMRELVES